MSKKSSGKKQSQPRVLISHEPQLKKKGFVQHLKRFYSAWAFVFGILGPFSLVCQFYPVVSIPSSSSLNKDNPFSAPFIISNQSIFAITDVQISYELKKVNIAYGKSSANFSNSSFLVPGAKEIGRHHSITRFLSIDHIIRFPSTTPRIDFAQVNLVIRYKYLLFRFEETMSFKSYQAPDNTVTWLPE
jgi:hypothetical protein